MFGKTSAVSALAILLATACNVGESADDFEPVDVDELVAESLEDGGEVEFASSSTCFKRSMRRDGNYLVGQALDACRGTQYSGVVLIDLYDVVWKNGPTTQQLGARVGDCYIAAPRDRTKAALQCWVLTGSLKMDDFRFRINPLGSVIRSAKVSRATILDSAWSKATFFSGFGAFPQATSTSPPAGSTGGTYKLTVARYGKVSLSTSPSGLSCAGAVCSGNFSRGSTVTLKASGTGWRTGIYAPTAGCFGAASCRIPMNGNKSATAYSF